MATREREKAQRRQAARQQMGPRAHLKWLRMSPRKVRLIADVIRDKAVGDAVSVLQRSQKLAAEPVLKLLRSAVANADDAGQYDLDKLYVSSVYVDEGPTWRRWMPRAMGRASRICKRLSHVSIELAER